MLFLSLRFIGHEHHFNYRLALEIGLIIALAISVSGAITGVSGQFNSLLSSTSGDSTIFIGVEQGQSLETSEIPYSLYESIDNSFINYKIPFLVDSVTLDNDLSSYIYYTSLSNFFNFRSNFFIKSGFLPNKSNELLIGEGFVSQLGLNKEIPFTLRLKVNGFTENRNVTGIFKDSGPWNFALLGNISFFANEITSLSGFEFQIKNNKIFDAFTDQLQDIIVYKDLSVTLDIIELKQVTNLSNSFLQELSNLFTYLLVFLFLLLILKLVHASYTLYNRLKREYRICKLLGMRDRTLQRVFYYNLAITGNIGLLYGFLLGIAFPQLLVILLKIFGSSQILNLLPDMVHLIQIFIISNVIFYLSSFIVYRVQLN